MEQFVSRMSIGRNANEAGVRKPKGKTHCETYAQMRGTR